MEKDMTIGSPMRIILNFSIPVFIGNIFQQLYNMVDTIIVGKFVGTNALAAVGSTTMVAFLILGFLMGLTAGFTVLTAQRFGVQDLNGMRKTVGSAAVLSAISAVVITVLSMTTMRPLLTLMQTPSDIFADAYRYIMIICAGIAAQVLYNLLANILRAMGNSKIPLLFLILSAILNIGLDLLLIITFRMGVAGAAYATVISQGVSGLLCLIYIIKKVPLLKLSRSDLRLEMHLVKLQMGIGLPMAFQFSITAIGTLMVQAALNMLGSVAVAAYTAASKIDQLVTQAYAALGTTMATYCAQNMGAGRVDRIRQGFRSATMIGTAYSLVMGVVVFFWGKYLTILFVSDNVDTIMGYVDIYVKAISLFFMMLMIIMIYRNGIQGMGFAFMPMMAGVAELAGRAVVAFIAAGQRSYTGVCMANPVAWVLAAALLVVVYISIIKKLSNRSAESGRIPSTHP